MSDYLELNFDQLFLEILFVLHKHGLSPNGLGLHISMPTDEYKKINPRYFDKSYPDMINKSSEKKGIIWNIKILRRLDPGDLPSPMQPPLDLPNKS